MPSIEAINGADRVDFVTMLGAVFEHSPWVADRTFRRKPFASLDALHVAMLQAVRSATREEQLALVLMHPELAGREASAGTLSDDSTSEQGRLGFTTLQHAELERIKGINRAYREKFGFPCIVALRLHQDRATVLAAMERRLANDADTELANAVEQIGHITRGRLERIIESA